MFSGFKKSKKSTEATVSQSAEQKSLLDALAPAANIWPTATTRSQNGSFLTDLNRAKAQTQEPVYEDWQRNFEQPAAHESRPIPAEQANSTESEDQSSQINRLVEKLAALRSQRGFRSASESTSKGSIMSASNGVQTMPSAAGTRVVEPNPISSYLSFGAVIRRLLASWWLILFLGMIGAIIAAGYAVSLPNKYESIAEILIEPRESVVLEGGVAPTGLNREATIAYAESQVRIISSSSVIDLVIDELELQEDPEFNGRGVPTTFIGRFWVMVFGQGEIEGDPVSNAKSYFYENFYVIRINQTFTLQIGVTTTDPQKSALIANTVARIYMSDESIARSAAARSASQDLSGRLGQLQEQVRSSEEAVEAYRAENGLIDAEGKLISEVELGRMTEQLALAKVQTGDAKTKAEQASQTDLADVISGSVPSSLATNTLSQLRVEFARARTQLARVSASLGARHPDRIGAQSDFDSAQNALSQEMRRIVADAQDDFERAQARQAGLEQEINVLKASAVTDNSAKVKLRELSSQLDANRKIYEMVLLRSRETGEQEATQPQTARVISSAVAADKKSGPNRKVIVAGGAVGGGALGGILALIPLLFGAVRALANHTGKTSVAPIQRQYVSNDTDDLYGSSVPSQVTASAAPDTAVQQPVPQGSTSAAMTQQAREEHQVQMEALVRQEQEARRQLALQEAQTLEAQQALKAQQQTQHAAPQPAMQPQMVPQPAPMPMPGYAPQVMGYPMQQQPMMQPIYVQTQPVMPQPQPVMMYPWAPQPVEKKS